MIPKRTFCVFITSFFVCTSKNIIESSKTKNMQVHPRTHENTTTTNQISTSIEINRFFFGNEDLHFVTKTATKVVYSKRNSKKPFKNESLIVKCKEMLAKLIRLRRNNIDTSKICARLRQIRM